MRRNRIIKCVAIVITALAVLFIAGILAQVVINTRVWENSGGDYGTAPQLPSASPIAVARALFSFPEGPMALGVTLGSIGMLLIYKFGFGRGMRGTPDDNRNLIISESGSFGTAEFISDATASRYFDLKSARLTNRDILGMTRDGRAITLKKNTRLNSNIAICGASGTGKSRSISRNLILQAAKRGESIVITDPKSELYESMSGYLKDEGYTVRVFNLVNMANSDSWNCLSEVGSDSNRAMSFCKIVLDGLTGESRDPFWYNAELNLFLALVLYVSTELPQEKRTLGEVYDLLVTNDRTKLEKRISQLGTYRPDPDTGELLPPSPAFAPFSLFMQASETVRSSCIIGLGSKLQVMQSQMVREITSHDEIDLELPGKQKCAYFCVVSDQENTYEFLCSLFFNFLFIRLINYADSHGGLDVNVKLILDEFPNCCMISDFTRKINTIRSRGLSAAVFFQNVGQMRNRYPNDQWQEILGACDVTVFLGCTDILTAEYFSNRVGVTSVQVEGESRELSAFQMTERTPMYRKTNSLTRRQLLTPDEILRLQIDEELIFIRGQNVYRASRFDYSRHPDYNKLRTTRAVDHEPEWRKATSARAQAIPTETAKAEELPIEEIAAALPTEASQDSKAQPLHVASAAEELNLQPCGDVIKTIREEGSTDDGKKERRSGRGAGSRGARAAGSGADGQRPDARGGTTAPGTGTRRRSTEESGKKPEEGSNSGFGQSSGEKAQHKNQSS